MTLQCYRGHGTEGMVISTYGTAWCNACPSNPDLDSFQAPVISCPTLFEFLDWLARCKEQGDILRRCVPRTGEAGFASLTRERVWVIDIEQAIQRPNHTLLKSTRLQGLASSLGLNTETLLLNFEDKGFQEALFFNDPNEGGPIGGT